MSEQIAERIINSGLFDKDIFFEKVEEFLHAASDEKPYCVFVVDIENLKLLNEWYGRETGNKLLTGIGGYLKELADAQNGIAGYFGNDDFAILMPYDADEIMQLCDMVSSKVEHLGGKTGFLPAFGVYEVKDRNEPAFRMYDRAELARASVKGNYRERLKKFEPDMLEQLESQYVLLSDIQKAFEEKEFTFFLQPKCNMLNGKVIGAEALVRWMSKEHGMISPGVFIPLLETTGFIAELDAYIWEEVCKWQRSMLDRGRKTVPVSVNVSRIDVYSMDVASHFCELIQRYDLDPKLIELEITESAYTKDDEYISRVVTNLRKAGFRVLMDDFGSGYSSLNMLKEIEVDVLKIDMRFLDINEENATKGVGILEAIRSMASLLGIGVIAEGVETEEQKEFLLKIGCNYGQGYYYYRPIPVQEFENVIENSDRLDNEGIHNRKVEQLFLKDLLSEDMFSEIMINNMLGAVAFYDICGETVTVSRYNEQYASLLGNATFSSETNIDFKNQLYEEDHTKFFWMFEEAKNNRHFGAECDVRRRRPDGNDMWLHLKTFFLNEQDGHSIYYSSVSDVSELYWTNKMLEQQNETLRFLNRDMPGGYYRHKNTPKGEFMLISQRFLDIFGFTRKEIKEEFDDKFINMVHPDDRILMLQSMQDLEQNGGNYCQPYRMRSKNGYIRITDQSRLVQYDDMEFYQGIVLCDLDYYTYLGNDVNLHKLTGSQENDDIYNAMNLMPCGVFRAEADGEHQFMYISNSMLAILGYTRQSFAEKFKNCTDNMVYEKDREQVAQEVKEQLKYSNYVATEFRIELADGSLKWVYSRGRMTIDPNGKRWFYSCVVDYDYLKEKYLAKENK